MNNSRAPKPRKCKNKACGDHFIPQRPLQQACSIGCAIVLSKDKIRAEMDAKAKAERKADKVKKEAIKTRSDWLKEAQIEFNKFIRTRDAGKPCICCGSTETRVDGHRAHGWDCGHYRSVGSAPHLRFDERNAHRQKVACNRYGAGRAVDYRIGLIARIGLEAVEALEADKEPRKWSIDELIAIKATYRDKTKQLLAARAAGLMNEGVE